MQEPSSYYLRVSLVPPLHSQGSVRVAERRPGSRRLTLSCHFPYYTGDFCAQPRGRDGEGEAKFCAKALLKLNKLS